MNGGITTEEAIAGLQRFAATMRKIDGENKWKIDGENKWMREVIRYRTAPWYKRIFIRKPEAMR